MIIGNIISPFSKRRLTGSVSSLYIIATGGIITRDGDFLVHQLNSSTDFQVIQQGSPEFNTIQYIIIGGGGAGGSQIGGGGGAGGYLSGNFTPAVQFYPAVVGLGGVSQAGGTGSAGGNGGNSSIFGLTAIGGGGAGGSNAPGNAASSGGSGGGGGRSVQPNGASGTSGQGYSGGDTGGDTFLHCGGGGGASEPGSDGDTLNNGNGGNGIASSITGTSITRAGGGGGGGFGAITSGLGGSGGGGNGGHSASPNGQAGQANTGSGGGGSYDNGNTGGDGGTGVIILRYYSPASFGIMLEGLNLDIDGMLPRDSAEYFDLNNGEKALIGGWNNDLFLSSGNQTNEFWTTTDFIDFTQETNLPFRISHAVGGVIGDSLYIVGFCDGSFWASFKINTTTKVSTIINSNLSDTGQPLEDKFSASNGGFFVNGTAYIMVTPDTDPAAIVNIELYKSTDFNSWTYVMDMPDYMSRANCFVDGEDVYIAGGGQYNGSFSGPNYITNIYHFNHVTESLTVSGSISEIMNGLWAKFGKVNNVWIYVAGWAFEYPGDTRTDWREGGVYYSFDKVNWARTEHTELLTRHATSAFVEGNFLYIACGHLYNDSYKIYFVD